jgi:hypothetical protein
MRDMTAAIVTSLAFASLASADEPRVTDTTVIGPFTGADAALDPANRAPQPIAYYGTDLGFSYAHGGKIQFLFGDTWATEAYAPIEASSGSRFDDGFGAIAIAAWPDPRRIDAEHIPTLVLEQNPGTTEMAAMNPGHALDLGKTPMAGFSNGTREFAIFNLTKPVACRDDPDCGTELACDTGLGFAGAPPTAEEGLTLPCIDGMPGCNAQTMESPPGDEPLASGFCSDPTSAVWAETPAGRASAVALRQRIGIRSTKDPRIYAPLHDWLTNKFENMTARVAPAPDAHGPRRLLLWGRPGFVGVGATGRDLGLYFAYVDLPTDEHSSWTVHYYAGLDRGRPRFATRESAAQPLDLDAQQPGNQPLEQHDIVHQMSVAFVAPLERWVMFYGGGITTLPSPPLPVCGVLQLFAATECKQVETGNGAIRMRTAKEPWGPWSRPQDVLVGGVPTEAGSGQYGPGGVLRHPDCTAAGCAPHSRTPFYHEDEYGFLYSANLIEEWIVPAGGGVDVLWNASTWDPYRVVLIRTRIER